MINLDLNHIIVIIMVFFVLVGAADKIIGDRLGLGRKFEEGIMAMGTLVIATAGLLVLAPLLGSILKPIIAPIFGIIGADPGVFAGMVLDFDTGGAALVKQMADNHDGYAIGMITSAMLGVTITFNIPVAMSLTKKEYQADVAKGILVGIITIPIGLFVGSVFAGVSVKVILINIIPVAILSVIIIICLWKWERIIVKVFIIFGKVILGISIAGTCVGVLAEFVGIMPWPGIMPLREVFGIIGDVAVILAGAFVLVELITRLFKIKDASVSALLVSLANAIPIFSMMGDMNERGRIITSAFCVSAAFVFGDHLGFAAGFDPDMVASIVIAKLIGGLSAVILALILTSNKDREEQV
ncbi:MAG: ethanolamine utilization protein EutH [Bacillota bacterium]|nr:ethanolamine utilization protein EutH [Bacillota bacterium]